MTSVRLQNSRDPIMLYKTVCNNYPDYPEQDDSILWSCFNILLLISIITLCLHFVKFCLKKSFKLNKDFLIVQVHYYISLKIQTT